MATECAIVVGGSTEETGVVNIFLNSDGYMKRYFLRCALFGCLSRSQVKYISLSCGLPKHLLGPDHGYASTPILCKGSFLAIMVEFESAVSQIDSELNDRNNLGCRSIYRRLVQAIHAISMCIYIYLDNPFP